MAADLNKSRLSNGKLNSSSMSLSSLPFHKCLTLPLSNPTHFPSEISLMTGHSRTKAPPWRSIYTMVLHAVLKASHCTSKKLMFMVGSKSTSSSSRETQIASPRVEENLLQQSFAGSEQICNLSCPYTVEKANWRNLSSVEPQLVQ